METCQRIGLVVPAGEVGTKSRRTRRWFRDALRANIEAALRSRGIRATVRDEAGRLSLVGDVDAAARAAAEVFGVRRTQVVQRLGATTLDRIVDATADAARDRVAGRTFEARVRRHGSQPWRSVDAERRIGTALDTYAAGVDLDDPDVTVRVLAYDDDAFLVEQRHEGPGGLPVGTQDEALMLMSGGFDSAVAAWHLLRRGVPLHFLHVELACAQTDTALAVTRELWRRWAPGTDPVVWVVDFAPVRRVLLDRVDGRVRQVRLKELMVRAADEIAEQAGIPALATGEAIGQVSTQTIRHLAVIDAIARRLVLRPLAGFDKEEIVAAARRVGTHDLSVRGREVCDLSDGPVATRARDEQLAPARAAAPDTLAVQAATAAWRMPLSAWTPGMTAPWAA